MQSANDRRPVGGALWHIRIFTAGVESGRAFEVRNMNEFYPLSEYLYPPLGRGKGNDVAHVKIGTYVFRAELLKKQDHVIG